MCKVCDKSIYFDSDWSVSDAGYGDTDYGGITKNVVFPIICPCCGKVKKSAIKKFGSVEKVLSRVLLSNMSDPINLVDSFIEVMTTSKSEQFIELMKINSLEIKDGGLFHTDCNKELISNIDSISSFDNIKVILNNNSLKFCNHCGVQILPLKIDIDLSKNETLSMALERIETWNRGK